MSAPHLFRIANMIQNNSPPYLDSPPTSRPSSPSESTERSNAPPPKPLPSVPEQTHDLPEEPYRDEPLNEEATQTASEQPRRYRRARLEQTHFPPYTDNEDGTVDNDDVPLGYLYPYPTEAPPSYTVAVRQSFRDTLILHVPSNRTTQASGDEEEGGEREYPDDVRFRVERVVGLFLAAFFLLGLSAVLFLYAIGMGPSIKWA